LRLVREVGKPAAAASIRLGHRPEHFALRLELGALGQINPERKGDPSAPAMPLIYQNNLELLFQIKLGMRRQQLEYVGRGYRDLPERGESIGQAVGPIRGGDRFHRHVHPVVHDDVIALNAPADAGRERL
jgi:hypothetical protein